MRHRPSAPMKVAITGASGYVGTRLIELLESEAAVERVIGIDIKPPPREFGKLEFHSRDIRDPGLAALLQQARPDVVVHLAFVLNPIHNRRLMRDIDVNGTANVLKAAAASGARKLIVASSATAYGAYCDNPDSLPESAPTRGNPGFSYAADKAAVEEVCRGFAREHPGVVLTVLRPCIIVGPNQRNYILDSIVPEKRYYMVRGSNPRFQFVHEDDVARLYVEAVLQDRPGAWNVAGDGVLTLEEMARITGKPVARARYAAGKFGLSVAWALRRTGAPPGVLDFLVHPWLVDTRRIKEEWGFKFRHTSEEAFRRLVESKSRSS